MNGVNTQMIGVGIMMGTRIMMAPIWSIKVLMIRSTTQVKARYTQALAVPRAAMAIVG
jgi:hypothetical protein